MRPLGIRALLLTTAFVLAACSDDGGGDGDAGVTDAGDADTDAADTDAGDGDTADAGDDAVEVGDDADASDTGGEPRFAVPLAPDSPWPKFRANEAQTGMVDFALADDGRDLWVFPTGKGIFSTPVVGADGTVYVGSASRFFYALDGETGALDWSFETGEIIDSSALLDDRGLVYFGSGDGTFYALDAATGELAWSFDADEPSGQALINWFEGNVAMGLDGTLYVPNDNFFVYALDRDDGEVVWRFRMPDQTWSLPAVDVQTGDLFIGNNNVVELFGGNTYSITPDGDQRWEQSTLGTIAASPALVPGGPMIVGGFDGFVRALDRDTGDTIWEFGARDHIYASPAVGDGIVVQAAADGTVYALDPEDGEQLWAYDWGAPIRSSPAIDADGTIYMGTGDGHLLVLDSDGTFRWAIELISDDRDDMNASPALGHNAVYIAGESGEVFGVPADYCLRDDPDERCVLDRQEAPDGVELVYTTRFGTLTDATNVEIASSDALAFHLRLRADGDTSLAFIDGDSVTVTTDPEQDVELGVSADRRFLTLVPGGGFFETSDGSVTIDIEGDYLVDAEREGLAFSGGSVGGQFSGSFTFDVDTDLDPTLALNVPGDGGTQTVWEMSRLAAPTPTLLPSYNQIGFDSLHFLVGLVAPIDDDSWLGWIVEGIPAGEDGATVPRAGTRGVFPVVIDREGPFFTMLQEDGLSVEVMSAVISFETFRMAATLGADLDATGPMTVHATTECGGITLYGPFLRTLGLCNPTTDLLIAYGAALLTVWDAELEAPAMVDGAELTVVDGRLSASFASATLDPSANSISLLLANSDGLPVGLDYGPSRRTTTDDDGRLTGISLGLPDDLSGEFTAYLLVDTYPVASGSITL